MKKYFTPDEIHALLERKVREAGGQRAFITKHKIGGKRPMQALSGALKRRRLPSSDILRALNAEKVVLFKITKH